MTYSIVARDSASGTLGVAVQSCFFCVGAVVPWATTGAGCIDHAGHSTGDGFTVQANMMASPSVWPAMADAYTSATGPLPRRLLAALEAAQAAGGDARGVMSAALVVVGSTAGEGRLVDVRVDHSSDPLGDLARLLDAADAYDRFNRGVDKLFQGDAHAALADVDTGLGILPGEPNLQFLRAAALLGRGDLDPGRHQLRSLLASHPTWEIIIRGYAAKGLLPLPGDDLDRRTDHLISAAAPSATVPLTALDLPPLDIGQPYRSRYAPTVRAICSVRVGGVRRIAPSRLRYLAA